jgi:hypothetical protein
MGKHAENISLGISRRKRESDIRIDFLELG